MIFFFLTGRRSAGKLESLFNVASMSRYTRRAYLKLCHEKCEKKNPGTNGLKWHNFRRYNFLRYLDWCYVKYACHKLKTSPLISVRKKMIFSNRVFFSEKKTFFFFDKFFFHEIFFQKLCLFQGIYLIFTISSTYRCIFIMSVKKANVKMFK